MTLRYDPARPSIWADYVVHLPCPEHFAKLSPELVEPRAELLRRVRYLLVVGSLLRPRRIAEAAVRELGLKRRGSYFDIVTDHAVADREFNVEVVALDDGLDVAIASHGIGGSGAEIVIRELCALVHLVAERSGTELPRAIHGVGRSGTRGTLGAHDYGTVGVSTVSFDEQLHAAHPEPRLQRALVEALEEHRTPYALGKGISTNSFWTGQGRVCPTETTLPNGIQERRASRAQELLWSWVENGIDFVEMEDYTVHAVCSGMGIPSVSAGAIIARRFDRNSGRFVLDYDAHAKERSELLPALAILRAFAAHWRAAHA